MSNTAPATLITWYLHMTDRAQFAPAFLPDTAVQLIPLRRIDLAYYKFLYTSVGEQLRWRDRIIMPESELHAALTRPGVRVTALFVDGVPAGYYELVPDADGSTELAYFGLRPQFHGGGLGKHLLSAAIAEGWDAGAARIWLHTCNLDAPSALPNYQKRGFFIYETTEIAMPDRYK